MLDPEAMADLMDSFMPPLKEQAARDARRAGLLAIAKGVCGHFTTNAQISGPCTGLATGPGGGAVTGVAVIPPGSIT